MNPYTLRGMIRNPVEFFGRDRELREIFTLLGRPASYSIVGPRRIGKSSLLYQISNPSVYTRYLAQPERYVFIFLDLLELAKLEVDGFFQTVLERVSVQTQGRIKVEMSSDGGYTGFSRFIQHHSAEGWKFVLCFDEFERMSSNASFGDDFFGYLRSLAYNYNLAYVISSQRSLFELCRDKNIQTSQFWNIFTQRKLGLMPRSEAVELAKVPFKQAGGHIEDSEVEAVLEFAGTHPFFVQMACYHLFARKEEKGELDAADQVVWQDDAFQDSQFHFEGAWQRLNTREQQALKQLATGATAQIQSNVAASLRAQALVAATDSGLRLFSGSFHDFVRQQASPGENASALAHQRGTGENGVLERELADHRRRLSELQAQASGLAPNDAPAHLLHRIEAEQAVIDALQAELGTLATAQPTSSTECDLDLRVTVRARDGGIVLGYELNSPSGAAGYHYTQFPEVFVPGYVSLQAYQVRLRETLEALGKGRDAGGYSLTSEQVQNRLRGLGADLYRELFPPELRAAYRKFRQRVCTFQITSDDPWIPWELVRPFDDSDLSDIVDDDFLCSQYEFSRWLAGDSGGANRLTAGRLACIEAGQVQGHGVLRHAIAESQYLADLCARHSMQDSSPRPATLQAVESLLDGGGIDLWHFVAHGHTDPGRSNEALLLLVDGALRAGDIQGRRQTHIRQNRPLFFLNACRVGSQGWSLSGLEGWAARLVGQSRCGAFVAPLWAIDDELAFHYARAFYSALETGETIGRAARIARHHLRNMKPADPAWLAYSVYANPNARVTFKPANQ